MDFIYNISFSNILLHRFNYYVVSLCEVEDLEKLNCQLISWHIMYMSSRSENGKATHVLVGGRPIAGYYEMSATSIPVMLASRANITAPMPLVK